MIAALLRAIRDRWGGAMPHGSSEDDSPAFARGLALGAFVGAAIAGSTLWPRLHERSRDARNEPESATETAPAE
ncbi:MAG TPA: hypothetical protein VEX41_11230 [Candidatus Eisenbacteria bacterium]|nr:hypothetical protein [Candidatus Eisenbacteria bacterium]